MDEFFMKKTIALLLALVMLFALAACGEKDNGNSSSTPTPAPDNTAAADPTPTPETPDDDDTPPVEVDWDNPIKIGHIADLTGNEASTGKLAQQAVDFAADLNNENGGIAGRAVEIITKDSMSTPATAVAMSVSWSRTTASSLSSAPPRSATRSLSLPSPLSTAFP